MKEEKNHKKVRRCVVIQYVVLDNLWNVPLGCSYSFDVHSHIIHTQHYSDISMTRFILPISFSVSFKIFVEEKKLLVFFCFLVLVIHSRCSRFVGMASIHTNETFLFILVFYLLYPFWLVCVFLLILSSFIIICLISFWFRSCFLWYETIKKIMKYTKWAQCTMHHNHTHINMESLPDWTDTRHRMLNIKRKKKMGKKREKNNGRRWKTMKNKIKQLQQLFKTKRMKMREKKNNRRRNERRTNILKLNDT